MKPVRGKVNLEKQMLEIERLRAEMRTKAPDQRSVTTRAVARLIAEVHLEGRMGKFVARARPSSWRRSSSTLRKQ